MNLLRINPFNEMDSWLNSYNHSLASKAKTMSKNNDWAPNVDIIENEENFVISAELAGIPKSDIDVHVDNNILTLSGERKGKVDDEKHHRIERFYGRFSRSFSLPENVDSENIQAESKDGILSLFLPKKEAKDMLKKIEIQ